MYLDKNKINAANDIKTVEIDVPEWGGKVLVAEMNGHNRSKFELYISEHKDDYSAMREYLVALTLVDEAGNNIFSEDEAKDLGKKNGSVLDRIFNESIKLNKLFESELDKEVKKS